MDNQLKHKILSAMAKHNLTQDQIANAMGVTAHAVSDWLRGRKPHPAKLKKLTDYLDSLETEETKSHARAPGMTIISVALPIELKKQLAHAAELEGKTISNYVLNALKQAAEMQSLENEKEENTELEIALAAKDAEIARQHEIIRLFATAGFCGAGPASTAQKIERPAQSPRVRI
jgi:transcriptional regulator with XRE-family HTH domain